MDKQESVWYLLPRWLAVAVISALMCVALLTVVANLRDEFWIVYVDRPIGEVLLKEDLKISRATAQAFWSNEEPAPSTYEELLISQNPDLQDAISRLGDTGCRIQIIQAAGGYGKSGLISQAIAKQAIGRPEYIIDLRQYASTLANTEAAKGGHDEEVSTWPTDLQIDGERINGLPGIDRDRADSLVRDILAKAKSGALVQLDSLDEVHSTSVFTIINVLKANRSSLSDRGLDVVIFTRPEVVDRAITFDSKNNLVAGIELVHLKPHRLGPNTLELRVRNYLDHKAGQLPKDDPSRDSASGHFVGTNDNTTIKETTENLLALLKSNPHLIECLRLSELSRHLIESAWSNPKKQVPLLREFSEARGYIHRRLANRSWGSHMRPEQAKGLYQDALAAVAASVDVDSDGYFSPPLKVDFESSGKPVSVDAYDVLQRSQFIDVVPGRGGSRLRFEPIWLRGQIALGSPETVRVFSPLRAGVVGFVAVVVILLANALVHAVKQGESGAA